MYAETLSVSIRRCRSDTEQRGCIHVRTSIADHATAIIVVAVPYKCSRTTQLLSRRKADRAHWAGKQARCHWQHLPLHQGPY